MSDPTVEEKSFKFTSEFIIQKLANKHSPDEWAFFGELRIGTGFAKDNKQRLDAWAIHYHSSKRHVTRAIEIKISRSDFFNEVKKPTKRRAGLRLANEFIFVVPKDLLKIEEVPPECGLWEVTEDGSIIETIVAPFRDVMPPTWSFMASFCRRFDRERLQQWLTEGDKDYIVRMHGAIMVEKLDEHIQRYSSWRVGSKEVPDKIAEALREVREEVIAAIRENTKA